MTTISASKFKEQCLALLDNVGPEGIVITKHGKPVAKLMPMPRNCADLIGCLKGEVRIKGDIFSTGITWDAESRHPHLFARPQRRARTWRTGPADR